MHQNGFLTSTKKRRSNRQVVIGKSHLLARWIPSHFPRLKTINRIDKDSVRTRRISKRKSANSRNLTHKAQTNKSNITRKRMVEIKETRRVNSSTWRRRNMVNNFSHRNNTRRKVRKDLLKVRWSKCSSRRRIRSTLWKMRKDNKRRLIPAGLDSRYFQLTRKFHNDDDRW